MSGDAGGLSGTTLRVLAMMESQWVTGPAKNLIAFASYSRKPANSSEPRVELSVVAFDRPSSPACRFINALRDAEIPTYVIREKHVGDPRVVSQLLAFVRSARPDILQTHNSKSHLLVRLMRLHKRLPWIAFFHGFTDRDAKDRFYNRIGSWALRGAPRIVTVCQAFAADLVRSGVPPSRIAVRHNIVQPFAPPPPGELQVLRTRLGILPGDRVVLAVGRLSAEKAHADLLEAIADLAGDGNCLARFVIVGDGPERSVLERRARELGIAGLVHFAGYQADVRPYYAIADAFVLPSRSEGSPNVLLEAMAAGLPIVSTRAGGAAEIVADGITGLLVPPSSPRKIGSAIRRLLDDDALARRLGVNAGNAAREYSVDAYARSLRQIYSSMLQ